MRLKQIKLAGFKSFVDPTSFEVPGQLVGVVGPNGCGKSNIIDAVRWVLGETRASELRGESMQDVIFSGSADRKPSARASVELVFDNSQGRIGGSWGSFAEISVKRVLTRDGQSNYFVNNQSVRRKDVHDIFLGTGLGPRAYAIIGQGMISRIIEARPEELRVFLEEAAGVSRYKERRRETENRLADTRENLTRVEDIRRELSGQIERLERQAEVAQQYREFELERESRQNLLWLVRRDEATTEQTRQASLAAAAINELERRLADLRALEADLERQRAEHYAAGDGVHTAQGAYYEANSEVTRLESEIRRVVDSQGRLGERIASLRAQEDDAVRRRETAQSDAELDRERGALADERAENLAQTVAELADALPGIEGDAQTVRTELDEARAAALRTRQAIELSATRRRNAEQSLDGASRRRERLQEEAQGLGAPPLEELEAARVTLAAAEEREQQLAQELENVEAAWRTADEQRAPAQQRLREAEAQLARLEARVTALTHLQDRAHSQARIVPWLARHGLDSMGRLWQRLRIDDGWETAVEAVLRECVESIEAGRIENVAALSSDEPPAKVAFHTIVSAAASFTVAPVGLRPAIELLRTTDATLQPLLQEWLHGWFVADSVESAAAQRGSLPPGGRFITRQGHVVGRLSLQLYAPESEQEGVLARQHEIDNLGKEARAHRLLNDDARADAIARESAASSLAERLAALREEHNQSVRRVSVLKLDAQRLEQQSERFSLTRERLDRELSEVASAISTAEREIDAETDAFDRLDAELAERQQHAEELAVVMQDREREVTLRRAELRDIERQAQEAGFARRELAGRLERLAVVIEESTQSQTRSRDERERLESELRALSDEAARAALDEALAARLTTEQALSTARARLDELTAALKARDEERLRIERDQEPLRQRVSELQLKEQAARLNAEQFAAMLDEAKVDVEALRASLAEGESVPRASWLQGEVTRLTNAIAALGAVNLAALDELTSSRERKGFLDAQSADLGEAIATLEDAIRKIDRETRDVLQDTYDTVNREFGKLFPELFGGGEARLTLTGGEILDAGVQVIAQPPGKRNTSIHLLSGGEKALTAIALVFAMFQLNPAPFCLLDEVDAPLDDANTERYADMVRRMSGQTQFLFITHNKIAMELAHQLIGVTMQERGVSRIVAVDLESASRLAEAA